MAPSLHFGIPLQNKWAANLAKQITVLPAYLKQKALKILRSYMFLNNSYSNCAKLKVYLSTSIK